MLDLIKTYLSLTEEEIENHPHLIINAFDHEHRILLWNKQCENQFGLKGSQVIGKKLEDVLPYTKKHEKLVHLNRALSGKEVVILNDKYAIGRLYEQRVIPIKDASGKVIAALNIVRNLP